MLSNRGVTVVVMPLISLIQDQVIQMNKLGIPCLSATKASQNTLVNMINEISRGLTNYPRVIYATPEKIVSGHCFIIHLDSLYKLGLINRFVVDEAHCVSSWGHEFRKDYLSLNVLRTKFPEVPFLALTATVVVRCHVIDCLKMSDKTIYFQTSFNRPNLFYDIVDKPKNLEDMYDDIAKKANIRYKNQCGLIYCCTVKECEAVYNGLVKRNVDVRMYHAKLSDSVRMINQKDWMADNCSNNSLWNGD